MGRRAEWEPRHAGGGASDTEGAPGLRRAAPLEARWVRGHSLGLCRALSLAVACALGGAAACVSDKASTDPPEEVRKYILDKVPESEQLTQLNVNFDDKVTLLGVHVEPGLDVEPGKRVKLTMYWRVDKPIENAEWKLFTHVLDGSGDRVMNIDNVGPLRHIRRNQQTWPPGSWSPGKVYVDTQSFTVPRKPKSSKLQVVAGIWKGRDRMPIRSGPSVSDNRALVATFDTGLAPAAVAGEVPRLQVAQLKPGYKVRIDGKLSEYAWETAADTSAFVNVSSGRAAPESPVQGRAKLIWDEQALYLGVEIKDQDIAGGFDPKQSDPHLWTKDCLEIMIDPDGDGDNEDYYEIQINPQNLVFDSQFDAYNRPRKDPNGPFGHQDWSSKLESAVQLRGTLDNSKDKDEGYVVEARIPWSSFGKAKQVPPAAGSTWRLNLYAMQDNQGVAWSPILGQGNFHKASRFGRVEWVLQPSASARQASAPQGEAPGKAENVTAPAKAAVVPASAPASDGPALSVSKKALQQAPAPAETTPRAPGHAGP